MKKRFFTVATVVISLTFVGCETLDSIDPQFTFKMGILAKNIW